MSESVGKKPEKTWQRGRRRREAPPNALAIRNSIVEHLNALFPDHNLKTQVKLLCMATGFKENQYWFRMCNYTVDHLEYSTVRMYYLLCNRGVIRPGEVIK